MSETYQHYQYSCLDSSLALEKVSKEIEKAYKRAKVEITELVVGRATEKSGFFTITLKGELDQSAIKHSLNYLSKLPGLSIPYASIEFDQTNETLYYVKSGKDLISFNDDAELLAYIKRNDAPTIEPSFYEQFGKNHSTLLVRITIPNKRIMKSFYEVCLNFTKERSDLNYSLLKKYIDEHVGKSTLWQMNFPSYTHGSQRYLGNSEYAKSLVLCEKHDDFLFLGYSFGKTVQIDIHPEDNGAPFCIKNVAGKQIYAMLEILWAISERGLKAKFRPSMDTGSTTEGYFAFTSDVLLYKERPVSNDMLWQ